MLSSDLGAGLVLILKGQYNNLRDDMLTIDADEAGGWAALNAHIADYESYLEDWNGHLEDYETLRGLFDDHLLEYGALVAWLLTHNHSGGVQGKRVIDTYAQALYKVSQGTSGGTFTSGSWIAREFNALAPGGTGILLSGSTQFAIPAGTYRCRIMAQAYSVRQHQLRLVNVSKSPDEVLILGANAYAAFALGGSQNAATLVGQFTLAADANVEVQHRCTTTRASDGMGKALNVTYEIYAQAEFWREVD